MSRRALIAVTHLLGVGHLTRAAALARGLMRAGWRVTLVSGGRPAQLVELAGIDVVQLPPVHCVGTDFRTLLASDGAPIAPEALEIRRRLAVEAVLDLKPDVLITELYPFGRRQLRAEFEALVSAAAGLVPRPAILSSLRDVPNPPSSPGRAADTLATLARWFDAVLVHGDPDFVPLDAAWPVDAALRRRLRPTGYLHDGIAGKASAGERGDVLVSGGGSAAGLPLCRAAVGAARLTPDLAWRVLAGHGIAAQDLEALAASAPSNAVVERARADFRQLLAGCRVSVSQAGYNTVLDLAEAGARAVLVPFAEGGEREQTIRAEALAERGLARVLSLSSLTPRILADAVVDAAARPVPDWSALRRDGVARGVAIIDEEVRRAADVAAAWTRLEAALAELEAVGMVVPIWLRDDDATTPTEALRAFLARMTRRGVPVALAVIPSALDPALGALVDAHPGTAVLTHGWSHVSHASAGAKTSEYPPGRDGASVTHELVAARQAIEAVVPQHVVPIFVPPWNRMASDAAEFLEHAGYRALSVMAGSRRGAAPPGPPRLDVHWDPIDWRGTRGLADEGMLIDRLIALLREQLEPGPHAPLGLLTHHAVHDGWIDRFLDTVIDRLLGSGAVRFATAEDALDALSPVGERAG